MKRLLITLAIFALAFNLAGARKVSKAGKVADGAYLDSQYGFGFAVPDEWDISIKKDKKPLRATLVKKEYDIPLHFQHVPTYTTVPKVMVYADTTSMALRPFIDSLLSDQYKSDQKKQIMSEFNLLYGDFVLKKSSNFDAGDLSAWKISGEQKYTVRVTKSGMGGDESSGNFGEYDVVTDFYGGSVFFAKKDNVIVMMQFICEARFFDTLDLDFEKIVKTFKFE